mmetsp:Transcript_28931/g.63749  ORF Transcript_28931/g.63749 Transcript_28931/m.63749 type:complete len:206 (-) Transcript_28931:581-1198(-)
MVSSRCRMKEWSFSLRSREASDSVAAEARAPSSCFSSLRNSALMYSSSCRYFFRRWDMVRDLRGGGGDGGAAGGAGTTAADADAVSAAGTSATDVAEEDLVASFVEEDESVASASPVVGLAAAVVDFNGESDTSFVLFFVVVAVAATAVSSAISTSSTTGRRSLFSSAAASSASAANASSTDAKASLSVLDVLFAELAAVEEEAS